MLKNKQTYNLLLLLVPLKERQSKDFFFFYVRKHLYFDSNHDRWKEKENKSQASEKKL